MPEQILSALRGVIVGLLTLMAGLPVLAQPSMVPVTVDGTQVKLATITHKPAGAGPFPILIFHHGSTGRGTDPSLFARPYEQLFLADWFVARGWAVVFPSRRGRGGSEGIYDEGFDVDRARGYACDDNLSVKGADHGLRAEVAADGVNECGVGDGGGVDADLVGARIEYAFGVAGGADAAPDRERDEELAGGAADGVEESLAAFMGRGDVEENDFVGAFAGVARGLRGGVAGIDEIDELHAFDDPAVMHVEAGDDALGQHLHSRKLRRIFRPVAPEFSG